MSMDLSGQKLGEFELLALLGSGKFADVYRANWPARKRQVALKVFKDSLEVASRGATIDLVRMARDEARRSFSLDHPNIVKGYGLYELEGRSIMVMDLVEGLTLYDLLAVRRPVISDETIYDTGVQSNQPAGSDETVVVSHAGPDPLDAVPGPIGTGTAAPAGSTGMPLHAPLALGQVATIACHLCEALKYAHKQGVIHRDLKPENIFIDWTGTVRLGDFGVALAQEVSNLMRTGMVIGTVHYMSPEQAKGVRQIDGRSDIYSLGVVIYHMLTGTLPFDGALLTVLDAHQRQPPERPSLRREDIPPALEQVVLTCLAKDPRDRYGSAHDLAEAIKRAVPRLPLTDLPELAVQARPGMPHPAVTPQRPLREEAAGYCPDCGHPLTASETASRCGGCNRTLQRDDAVAEAKRLDAEAAAFGSSFKLDTVTDWGVLEWEYKRSVRPALEPKLQAAAAIWTELLSTGSVIPPQWGYAVQPNDRRLLGAAKQLLNLAHLWEADPVDRFLVHDNSVKERTRHTAKLRGQAYQLLGRHHCTTAAASTHPEEMVQGYTSARHWFGRAAETLSTIAPELSAAAAFSARLTQAILDYPVQPDTASDILPPSIAASPDGRPIPGLQADAQTLAAYRGEDARVRTRLRDGEASVAKLMERGNEALAAREAALKNLADRAGREERHVDARCSEINEEYRRDLGLFAGLGVAARIGVLIGPLLLLVLAGYLIAAIKGSMPWVMAAVLAAGALGLPLCAGYLGSKSRRPGLDIYDLSPLVSGIFCLWALLAFTFWYYGVTQPATMGLPVNGTIGWAAGGLFTWIGLWALVIWGINEELEGKLWYAFVIMVGFLTLGLFAAYGLAISHWLPAHFLWLLGDAVLLILLGWTAARTVHVIRNNRTLAQGRRSALLRGLNAESETTLKQIEWELNDQVSGCRNLTQQLTTQITTEINALEVEAQGQAARLLHQATPNELSPLENMRRAAAQLASQGAEATPDLLAPIRSPISQARSQLDIQIKRLPVTAAEISAAQSHSARARQTDSETGGNKQAEASVRRLVAWAVPTIILLIGIVVWGVLGVQRIPRRSELPPPITWEKLLTTVAPKVTTLLPDRASPVAVTTRAAKTALQPTRSAAASTKAPLSPSSTPQSGTKLPLVGTVAPALVKEKAQAVRVWFVDTLQRLRGSPVVTRAITWFEEMKVQTGLATPAPAVIVIQVTATSSPSSRPTATATKEAVASTVIAVVNVNRANVRSGPGTNYPVITIATNGTRASVIGRNAAGDWWYVCCFGGKQAWLADTVVRVEGPNAAIRALPTVNAPAR